MASTLLPREKWWLGLGGWVSGLPDIFWEAIAAGQMRFSLPLDSVNTLVVLN